MPSLPPSLAGCTSSQPLDRDPFFASWPGTAPGSQDCPQPPTARPPPHSMAACSSSRVARMCNVSSCACLPSVCPLIQDVQMLVEAFIDMTPQSILVLSKSKTFALQKALERQATVERRYSPTTYLTEDSYLECLRNGYS